MQRYLLSCALLLVWNISNSQIDYAVMNIVCPMGSGCDNKFTNITYDVENDYFILATSEDDPSGLMKLENWSLKPYNPPGLSIQDKAVKQLIMGPENSLYIVVPNTGLFRIFEGKAEEILFSYGNVFSQYIVDIEYDEEGFLWVAHDWSWGLYRLDAVGTVYDLEVSEYLKDLYIDHDGTIWISTAKNLYYIDDFETRQKKSLSMQFPSDGYAYNMIQDHQDNLWMAVKSDMAFLGLMKYDGNQTSWYSASEGTLPTNEITDMVVGDDGQVFIAFNDQNGTGALYQYNHTMGRFDDLTGLHTSLKTINEMEYVDGNLFLATMQGVSILSNEAQTTAVSGIQEEFVSVYPNPFAESIIIQGEHLTEYTLFNAFGQIIRSGPLRGKTVVTVPGTQGSYLITIRDDRGQSLSKQIIKSN